MVGKPILHLKALSKAATNTASDLSQRDPQRQWRGTASHCTCLSWVGRFRCSIDGRGALTDLHRFHEKEGPHRFICWRASLAQASCRASRAARTASMLSWQKHSLMPGRSSRSPEAAVCPRDSTCRTGLLSKRRSTDVPDDPMDAPRLLLMAHGRPGIR